MKHPRIATVAALAAACLAGPVFADRIVEVYRCEFNEGYEQEQVMEANETWIEWVHDNVDEDIRSEVGTAVVGNQEIFIFFDTYPDLETWARTQTALENGPENIQNLFEENSECSENRLWSFEDTE